MIIDNEADADLEIVNQLKSKHRLFSSAYDLRKKESINDWSGLNVNIFSIRYKNQKLDENGFKNNLIAIRSER